MKVGLGKYEHEAGECWGRKIATLEGPCGDPRCEKAFRDAFAHGISQAYNLIGECVNMPARS